MARMPNDIELSLELEPRPEAASKARRAIHDRFRSVLPGDMVVDLMTVVSELVNNAVLHGPGTPVKVQVNAGRDARDARGEVEDEGAGEIAMREMDGIRGGFGLHIVDTLVDRWGVYAGSTHVWFEMS